MGEQQCRIPTRVKKNLIRTLNTICNAIIMLKHRTFHISIFNASKLNDIKTNQ